MNSVLKYKGYVGSIGISEKDGIFVGEVLGLKNSLILYEGANMQSLLQDFHDSIDDYLNMCEAHGREPEKPAYIDIDIKAALEEYIAAHSATQSAS